jgi:hypothetical protein
VEGCSGLVEVGLLVGDFRARSSQVRFRGHLAILPDEPLDVQPIL